jgi:hypothetical protein
MYARISGNIFNDYFRSLTQAQPDEDRHELSEMECVWVSPYFEGSLAPSLNWLSGNLGYIITTTA